MKRSQLTELADIFDSWSAKISRGGVKAPGGFNETANGVEAFEKICDLLELAPASGDPERKAFENEVELYNEIFERFDAQLGAYFRILYNSLKHIQRLEIREEEEFAASLLRASITQAEAHIIAINCLTPQGDKLRSIVEDLHILKHARLKKNLVDSQILSKAYADDGDESNEITELLIEKFAKQAEHIHEASLATEDRVNS